MDRPKLTGLRERKENKASATSQWREIYSFFGPVYKGYTPTTSLGATHVTSVNRKTMYDTVIKNFHKRAAAGEIFNNPMYQVEEVLDAPLAEFTINIITHPGSGTPDSGQSRSLRMRNKVPDFRTKPSYANAANNAITTAYSNISANEGNTLLWLGEFKETVKMLTDIGEALKKLHASTSAARKLWLKGKLSIPEQQKLTLAIVFGLLPLEQSIADFMEGLFRTKDASPRNTARGFRVSADSKDFKEDIWEPTSIRGVQERCYWSEHVEVTARAGVLYEIDYGELPWVSVIMDPKSVISTAYALARLSFVIDWFINVGGTLAAWSPSAGCRELTAWVTVEVTSTMAGISEYYSTDSRVYITGDGGRFSRIYREKWRVPVSRSDLAIFPRFDMSLDLEKLGLLILLFAKIKNK